MTVGYEEVCLDTASTMQFVCRFIGVEYEASVLAPAGSTGHMLSGNKMRLHADKQRVVYDFRWFTRREWVLPSLFFRKVMAFNNQYVYSNRLSELFSLAKQRLK